jgi:hypothetical protein
MDYAVLFYKKDRRTRSGERLVRSLAISANSPRDAVLRHYQAAFSSYRIVVNDNN